MNSNNEKTSEKTYFVTIHEKNGSQIKDMDMKFDDPLDFIERLDSKVKGRVVSMSDVYLDKYSEMMGIEDVDVDEQASVWTLKTTNKVNSQYEIEYQGKSYIAKLHLI